MILTFVWNKVLWNSFNQNENYGLIKQKKNPFTNIKWSQKLFASSHDQTVHSYDPETGQLLKRYPHKTLINSIATNNSSLLASVGDDSTCLLFDTRQDSKYSVNLIKHEFPLLGVELGMCVYTGGIDGIIRSFDLRNASVPLYTLESHTDSVTSLKLQDDKLVSNSLDNTVQVHDIRPYSSKRLLKTLLGAPSGTDKGIHRPSISKDGNHVVCGSADKTVVVWSLKSGRILYKLPGHKGGVMECDWHPEHPIVLSGSIDKTLFLGELAVDVLNRWIGDQCDEWDDRCIE